VKLSKRRRKFVNSMRSMSDVPWPARRFRYPPTSGPLLTNQRCLNVVGRSRRRRRGWRGLVDLVRLRKPVEFDVLCGVPLAIVPHSAIRRGHLRCVRCGPIRRRR
jgi:hypothetical protein